MIETSQGKTAMRIAGALQSRNYRAYFVGGCVRDLLLGRTPKDYDIATDARPDQVIELFPRADLVGAHFGVVLVEGVEVATFRSDHSYVDGRRPEGVTFESDPRQDVLRRDFTINALLLDPQSAQTEQPERGVIDFVNGVADLRAGVIRAIGNAEARFQEDHLRMLRAIRFACRLGFAIEAETMQAIRKFRSSIVRVSPERVREELTRILTEGGARRGFELLDDSGLLELILPEVAAMKGVEQPPEFHPEGDVWIHTLMMLERMQSPTPALAWGVLLHDAGKPPTFRMAERIRFDGHVEAGEALARAILGRLRFSNEDTERVLALIGNHMRFKDVPQMRESTIKRFIRLPHFDEHLELHRLDCSASHGHLDNYELMKARYEASPPEVLRPPRLLTGDDLIAAGYRPGPQFSKMIEAVEDAQLEARVRTKEEAMDLVRSMYEAP
jgi:tRNA nucleotidyltransferase/poly(A) polymerase